VVVHRRWRPPALQLSANQIKKFSPPQVPGDQASSPAAIRPSRMSCSNSSKTVCDNTEVVVFWTATVRQWRAARVADLAQRANVR